MIDFHVSRLAKIRAGQNSTTISCFEKITRSLTNNGQKELPIKTCNGDADGNHEVVKETTGFVPWLWGWGIVVQAFGYVLFERFLYQKAFKTSLVRFFDVHKLVPYDLVQFFIFFLYTKTFQPRKDLETYQMSICFLVTLLRQMLCSDRCSFLYFSSS